MKRLKTIANDLLELAENMEEWDRYIEKIKKPEKDEMLQAIIDNRNELITRFLALDLETRFQFSERPIKAQNKWFKDNWGLSEATLDFYRNKKTKSITKQYNELDCVATKESSNEENVEDLCPDEIIEEEPNSNVLKEEKQIEEVKDDAASEKISRRENSLKIMNKRSIEDCIWDNCSESNLCLLEPFHHTPYKYGDIMENGKVYVWKGKYTDKETFFKSYTKSKKFLEMKKNLGLSVSDISKIVDFPKHIVNNALYYPYIKTDKMLVERFEKKFEMANN